MSALPLTDEEERFRVLVHLRGTSSLIDFRTYFPQYAAVQVFRMDDQGYAEFDFTQTQVDVLQKEGFLYLDVRKMCGGLSVSRSGPD